MQKNITNTITKYLGFSIFSSIVLLPQITQAASIGFPDLLPSIDDKNVCRVLQTVVPCKIEEEKFSENIWGAVGSLAYPLGAEEMQKRHPLGSKGLTPTQKQYLRPHFGGLVDEVTIHYDAVLLTELGYPGSDKKFRFGETEGQTFGLNIYISDSYKTSFQQLALIGHELIHSLQYKQRGSSLVNFGKDYFEGYKSAGLNYENNPMEKEAYDWQDLFIENDCASKNFSGNCLLKGEELKEYDFDFDPPEREIIFYLDGTQEEIIRPPDSPSSKNLIDSNFSETDQAAIAEIISQQESVPEPSSVIALIALSSSSLLVRATRKTNED